MSNVLKAHATLVWEGQSAGVGAHDVVILGNGWLRVTWLDGAVTHVSPAAVRTVFGKGVSYGA